MAEAASFDYTDLTKLAVDIGAVPGDTSENVRTAVKVSSLNIKNAWKAKLQGSATLPALPNAVTFDMAESAAGVESEIGFDKGRKQGALGNISEYGTPKTAPRGFGLASLNENQEDFERGIEIAIDQALKAAGL